MKEPKGNKVDQLFKDGLSGSENPIVFREQDWVAMRKLLKKNAGNDKNAIYPFVYYASAIAALLVLAFGLFLLNQQHTDDLSKDKITKRIIKSKPDNTDNNLDNEPLANKSEGKKNSGTNRLTNLENEYQQLAKIKSHSTNYYNPDTIKKLQQIGVHSDLFSKNVPGKEVYNILDHPNAIAAPVTAVAPSLPIENKKTQITKPFTKSIPVFSLSVLAAPDINGVNSFSNGQIGGNLGFQLGVHLSKKWSISTGAVYAVKPYGINTNTSNYTANGTYAEPLSYIDANCKVLDIPLNVNYQLYNKGKNTLIMGTGLSSYFMLKETYRYDYGPEYSTVQIKNKNRHVLGVLNVNTTYMRQVNSRFSIIAQPYIKLPLTGIGNGRVDLQSTGIGLGVNWNLNLKQKPK